MKFNKFIRIVLETLGSNISRTKSLSDAEQNFVSRIFREVIPQATSEHNIPWAVSAVNEPKFELLSTGRVNSSPFKLLIPAKLGNMFLDMNSREREQWVNNLHVKMEAMESVYKAWENEPRADFPRFIAGIYTDARKFKNIKENVLDTLKKAYKYGVLGEIGAGSAKEKPKDWMSARQRELRAKWNPDSVKAAANKGEGDILYRRLKRLPAKDIIMKLKAITEASDHRAAKALSDKLDKIVKQGRASEELLQSLLFHMKGKENLSAPSFSAHMGVLTRKAKKEGPIVETKWSFDSLVNFISSSRPADSRILDYAKSGLLGTRMKAIADMVEMTPKIQQGTRHRKGIAELKNAENKFSQETKIDTHGSEQNVNARHFRYKQELKRKGEELREYLDKKYLYLTDAMIEDMVQLFIQQKEQEYLKSNASQS